MYMHTYIHACMHTYIHMYIHMSLHIHLGDTCVHRSEYVCIFPRYKALVEFYLTLRADVDLQSNMQGKAEQFVCIEH